MEETWKSLKGIVECGDNYEISSMGIVKSISRYETYIKNGKKVKRKRNEKIMTNKFDNYGYAYVNLFLDGKKKICKTHRLVALAFIPNPDNLPTVNHKDGDKSNAHIDNLEWATYGENNKHAYDTGLKPKKLSDNNKEWIREVYKPYDKRFGSRALAKKFGVGQATISNIASKGRK